MADTPNPTKTESRAPLPSANPIPLTSAQEDEIRLLYHSNVKALCREEIKEFALCASGRTFSVAWACRPHKLAMNSCMLKHATQKMQDDAREEWFANLNKRKALQQLREEQQAEKNAYERQWWSRK